MNLLTADDEAVEESGERDYTIWGIDWTEGIEPPVKVDDKVILGVFSESVSTREDWAHLNPKNYEGLIVIQFVSTKYYNGQIAHWEAGK